MRLAFLAAWVDVILSCSFLLLLSYIVANVELLDVVRHDELLFRFLQPNLDKPLDADAYLRRAFHHFLVQPPCLHVGEHLSRLFTFRLCRVRVLAVLQASSISSKLLPEARGVSEASSSGSSSPYPSSSVGMLVKVSSSFSSGTCAGRDAFPVFPSSKVASSSDSSMPFSIVAASLRRYGSGCPGGCHPETALADDVRLFRGTSSCAAMRLASFPSSDRHNPTMP